MEQKKLFQKDFTLMVLGQIISLFGNSILRFSLSLYILDITGSAAIFGTILALSMIPSILFSPVGGMIADRVNRRNIMVTLDYITAGVIVLFLLLQNIGQPVILIGVTMIVLALIQTFYQPSVQASIPVLASGENLVRANGVVVQVNALANLLGPILGGLAFGFFGLYPIVIVSAVCFFISATMEIFIHIPFVKQARSGKLVASAIGDLKDAIRFLVKEQPVMLKLLFVIAGLNLFLSSMVTVGLPYIIKIFLGLSSQQYGFAEGALAIGSITGGLLAGLFAKKFTIKNSYLFLVIGSIFTIPMGLSLINSSTPLFSYAVILVCAFCTMLFAALFNIFAQTFAQQQTPNHMLGKVSSFIMVISMCAFPIGQSLYGILFDIAHNGIFIILIATGVISIFIGFCTKRFLKKLKV